VLVVVVCVFDVVGVVVGVVRPFVVVDDPEVLVEVDVDELLVDGGVATDVVVTVVVGAVESIVVAGEAGAVVVVVLVDVAVELVVLVALESEQLSVRVKTLRSTVPGRTSWALTRA
jgi:hypothetical protein